MWYSGRICRASQGSSIISKNNFQIVVPFYNDIDNFKQFVDIIENSEVPKHTFLLLDNGSENNIWKSIIQKINFQKSVRL